jgi:hypothetical protein
MQCSKGEVGSAMYVVKLEDMMVALTSEDLQITSLGPVRKPGSVSGLVVKSGQKAGFR